MPPPDRVISGDIPEGFIVPEGETWRIRGSVRVESNVIVLGTLRMRRNDHLIFEGVNEDAFEGSGMFTPENFPPVTDIGLYVLDGRLDLRGTPKQGWNRTGTHPSWNADDEIVQAPHQPGDYGFAPFALDGEVPQAYPEVPPTEILNLTRDCSIQGTPGGRTHVYIHSQEPQTLRSVLFRYMGPRKGGEKILGRWPLHLHHCDEIDYTIRDCIVRDAGSHAFVPHNTHGGTLLRCIAYDVEESPFWWDEARAGRDAPPDHFSNHTTYDRCVAAGVYGEDNNLRLTGFTATQGYMEPLSNTIRGCVATGIRGRTNASGFAWQEGSGGPPWTFEDNVAHNNEIHGLFAWQNTARGVIHPTKRFTAYNNGQAGIALGAYLGRWEHDDALLVGNGVAGVLEHARSLSEEERIIYRRPRVITTEANQTAFLEGEPNFEQNPAVIVCQADVSGPGTFVDEMNEPTQTFDFTDACHD